MNEKPLHVHIGPGALGHGLIGLLHDSTAVDLVLVHHQSRSPLAKHLAGDGPMRILAADGTLHEVRPFAYLLHDTRAGRSALIDLITSRRTIIITTSVRIHQGEVIAFLSGLPIELWLDKDVSVIPCENHVDPGWAAFASAAGATLYGEVVVDRICSVPDEQDPTVAAEDYYEFVVGRAQTTSTLAPHLVGAKVVDDIGFHRRRKLYLVNGLQLATALLAVRVRKRGIDERVLIPDFIATDFGREAFEGLALEYLLALHRPYAHERDILDTIPYLESAKARIASTPDRATRVIFGEDGDPSNWTRGALTKFDTRLTTPFGELRQMSGLPSNETTMWLAWKRLLKILGALE